MSRATRIEFEGAIYHVLGHGISQVKPLSDETEKRHFLALLEGPVESGDLTVHAFCLMTTHYHLLVQTPRGELSRWMHQVLGQFAQWFNLRHERSGYVWQGRYKAILVEGGPYLLECSRYIHLNPCRAGFSTQADRWKWSSYRSYIGGVGRPIVKWVNTKDVYLALGPAGVSKRDAARRYRKYVESAKGIKPPSPFERAAGGLVLGGETFIEWVKERLMKRSGETDEPSLRVLRRLGLVSPQIIENWVSETYGNPLQKGRARTVLIYCLIQFSGLRRVEVAERLGLNRSTITRGIESIEDRLQEDRGFRKTLAGISARWVGETARKAT